MKTIKLAFVAFLALAAVAALAGHPLIPPEILAGLGFMPMAMGRVDLKDLRDQRGKAIADARSILDKADAEKRGPTAEENAKYNELFGKAEELRTRIEREEQLVEAERQSAEQALRDKDAGKGGTDGKPGDQRSVGPRGTDEYRAAFRRFLASGRNSLTESEVRALQSDVDTAGGYMVMPEQMVAGLIKAVDDMVHIRQRATKYQVPSAAALGVPTLTADPDDADWTAELLTGGEDSTMAFGKRELHPHPLAKRIKISKKLLRQLPGTEALVMSRLAYKFAISQEKGFLTGSGAGQALGVFTASNDGIPTTRDISAGNLDTSPTFDGLLAAKFGLKGQYWPKAEWMFHRDVLLKIAQLKDGNGQYIWRESVRAGEPDRLLNLPVVMSEYAPNTLTTGLYAGILGDFSNYWIADALDMQVQRLDELYAESNQTGFIGRMESDGMPILAEAFVRVKLA